MRRYKVIINHKGGRFSLLDLDVPARSKGGIQSTENGLKLLEEICAPPGQDSPVAIVLLPTDAKCGVTPTKVMKLAARFIRKGATGKPGNPAPRVKPKPTAPVCFRGGEMVFYPDRVELCGVKILGDTGTGQSRTILEALSQRARDGGYVRLSGDALAKRIQAEGGVGTVTGCIRTIRHNIIFRMAECRAATCGRDDVVTNDGLHGYSLREWITVRRVNGATADSIEG